MLRLSDMLPTEVDCIVLGTGLTNSIIAAACSRIGKSVLHVDMNSYYGEEWASFTFQQLIDWIQANYPDNPSLKTIPKELIDKSRMFCIDLSPRLLFCNGSMVELLVKSNVSRYHEFKNNIRILSMVEEDIHVLPCKRSDVFNSKLVSNLIDKRRLMKFIELCIQYDPGAQTTDHCEISQNADKPIQEYLRERGLNNTLQQLIINSIAMIKPTDLTKEACEKIKHFIHATERYGRSPFIFPLYGCGEFPQSFCRLSAVFGGTYCLNTNIDNVKFNQLKLDDKVETKSAGKFSVHLSNKEVEVMSDSLVLDRNYARRLKLIEPSNETSYLSRAILITNKSIVPNEDNNLSFMRIPPTDANKNIVYFLEFNSSVMVCPPEVNIVYLWTNMISSDPECDLKQTVNRLYGVDSDSIIWNVYFVQENGQQNVKLRENGIDNLHLTSAPCEHLDYDDCIEEAENVFKLLCPGQEFLPRAPDPGEIIN